MRLLALPGTAVSAVALNARSYGLPASFRLLAMLSVAVALKHENGSPRTLRCLLSDVYRFIGRQERGTVNAHRNLRSRFDTGQGSRGRKPACSATRVRSEAGLDGHPRGHRP